jgi:hypothetical protein
VLEKVIGIDWSGSMTYDGFSSYERFEDVAHQQCVDHALRRARKLLEKQTGSGKIFPQQVIDLLMDALRLRDRFNEKDAYQDRRGHAYEDHVQRLRDLTDRPRINMENARFAKHLGQPCCFVVLIPGGAGHPGHESSGRASVEDTDCEPQSLGWKSQHGGRKDAVHHLLGDPDLP